MFLRSLIATLLVLSSGIDQILAENPPAASNNELIKKTLQEGVSSFAVKLSQLLSDGQSKSNILFSPVNVMSALTLLHLGAEGATRDELADVIGFPKDPTTISQAHEYFGNVLKAIQSTRLMNISVAAGLFSKKGFDLIPQYLEEAKKYYGSEMKTLDFSTQAATDFINGWIANKTENRIPQIFESPISPNTELLLASALYFAASWSDKFSPEATQPEKFNTGTSEIEVQMMRIQKQTAYTYNPEHKFHAIGIPYQSSRTIMYFVLPYDDQPIAEVIKKLKPQQLHEIVEAAKHNKSLVEYKIPRMKLSWSHDLNNELVSLGCGKLFSNPDLSKMVTASLKVSSVKHVTDMETNEDGTIASAVTIVNFLKKGTEKLTGPPIPFYVNKPHLTFIYHPRTKMILFTGIIYNPLEKK